MNGKFWQDGKFWAVLVATYVTTRLLERLAGFHYNILSGPLNVGELGLDFGLWAVTFCGYHTALRKILQRRKPDKPAA